MKRHEEMRAQVIDDAVSDFRDSFVRAIKIGSDELTDAAVKRVVADAAIDLAFAVVFDQANKDPLTINVDVSLADGTAHAFRAVSLRDVLSSAVDDIAADDEHEHGLSRLPAALRGLADEIDAILKV